MNDQVKNFATDEDFQFEPQWGDHAPRGGKSVLNRVLKEGTRVPLFLGQTFINSLRDVGYNTTTSALCEHVDNSIQAGATEIRVYFHQTGQRGAYSIDALVLDNGRGMEPHVLQVAMSFGGSMYYDNRQGIGRFGVGMKTAALSMSPAVELYSWTEPGAIYTMTLDVNDISSKMANLLELPEPQLLDALPSSIARLCRECGGNSRSAPPGRVGMTQLRRLRQERRVRRADRGFPIRRPSASGSGRMRAAPTEAWARFPVSAGPSGS